jgi:glycyl-tRNA synthetase beta chain
VKAADFLVEIGTEELPPKALRSLMDAFAEKLGREIDAARLAHASLRAYATPRRLAVWVEQLACAQEDRTVEHKGPPLSVAFDADGKPKPPALAFARKCGVAVSELGRSRTEKGEWLSCEQQEPGSAAALLMPLAVEKALAALPIPRRMRWGAGEAEFVRPVHWVVMLHGDEVIEATIMGLATGRESRGHRFHADRPIAIALPSAYAGVLESDGRVIADFDERRRRIQAGVAKAAAVAGGSVVDVEGLLDEVAALVEWPVPIVGAFDAEFLELPREAVISTLTAHQRYFPVADANGRLLPRFVTVANLDSQDPDQVRDGNERVIRPRLADAVFFWNGDRRSSLDSRQAALKNVVYQRGLGSLHDRSARVAAIAAAMAAELGVASAHVERAAMLAKCDLLTGMVGEFPELQGTMGRYYAEADGETDAVATAIGEHYLPRYAGDTLPATIEGQLLSVADKLETIAGVFALDRKPSGNRDPFALRRAALGIVRILLECRLDVDLKAAIRHAIDVEPLPGAGPDVLAGELYTFITERLRSHLVDRDPGLGTETFDAVLAREPQSVPDFASRLSAVQAFVALDEASSLAAANKRIANILRKSAGDELPVSGAIDATLFEHPAEAALHDALTSAARAAVPLLEKRDYTAALCRLADLRAPVDRFFDEVLVMSEDVRLRNNRLALLAAVRDLFLRVADISRLAID